MDDWKKNAVPWSEEFIKNIDFAPRGCGKGERFVAELLDGEVSGNNERYDVFVSETNEAWEVKYPVSSQIRAAADGIHEISELYSNILNVVTKVEMLFLDDRLSRSAAAVFDKETLEYMKYCVDNYFSFIKSGSVSEGLRGGGIKCITSIIDMVNDVFSSFHRDEAKSSISIDGVHYKVNDRLKVKVLKVIEAFNDIDDHSFLLEHFDDLSFKGQVLQNTWKNIKASDVFKNVTGIFLVDPLCYKKLYRHELDDSMKFIRIVGCRPVFRVL